MEATYPENPLLFNFLVKDLKKADLYNNDIFEGIKTTDNAKKTKQELINLILSTEKWKNKADKMRKEGYSKNDTSGLFEEDEKPKYADGGGVLLAPNGKPSNLTPEQYHLVRTPEFISWFGDWENDPSNASKVVDENGEPLVVYHGTSEKFTIFKDEGVVAKTMGKSVGFYFTPSKWSASRRSVDGEYIEVFLNIKKLHRLKKFSNDEDFIEILGNSPYDYNIKVYDNNDECVYNTTIKSKHWVKMNRKYFTLCRIEVYENDKLIYNEYIFF
jgi:hypothetical protein